MSKDDWKFVDEYPIQEYRCGLKAGDKVRLKHDIIVRDHLGNPTGRKYSKGDVWTILPGAKEEPVVVWMLQPNQERHTWDDDERIFETFERTE